MESLRIVSNTGEDILGISFSLRILLAALRIQDLDSLQAQAIESFGSFRKLGVPYFGVLIVRMALFRVLFLGSTISETPM